MRALLALILQPCANVCRVRCGRTETRCSAWRTLGRPRGAVYQTSKRTISFKMKAKIITLIVLLTGSVSLLGQSAVFVGTVASVVNAGEAVLVVEPSRYDNTGMTLKPNTAVYVYANFGNAIDGDRFK